jgi:plasminogen activator
LKIGFNRLDTGEEKMAFYNLKKSCICLFVICFSTIFALCSFAETAKAKDSGPVTVTSTVYPTESNSPGGRQNATDPVTTTYSTSTLGTQKPNEPVTTTTYNNPAAVSSKSHKIEKEAKININDHVVMVSGSISIGYVTGESKEFVYSSSTGNKLSELDWQISDVLMMGLGASIKPLSWLRFNGTVWFKLNDGDGSMNDYDWLLTDYGYNKWTNWSHSDTSLTKGILYDINAEITFLRFNEASVYGILGYKHDNWKWEAKGGTYDYWIWGESGNLPNGTGITYEQTYSVPYLGIGFHANFDPVTLSGRIFGSTFVKSSEKDHHVLRSMYYTENYSSQKMYGIDLACTYNFTEHLAATAAVQHQEYFVKKGDEHGLDLTTGERYTWDNGAGMSNEMTMFSLSFLYTY